MKKAKCNLKGEYKKSFLILISTLDFLTTDFSTKLCVRVLSTCRFILQRKSTKIWRHLRGKSHDRHRRRRSHAGPPVRHSRAKTFWFSWYDFRLVVRQIIFAHTRTHTQLKQVMMLRHLSVC